MTDPIATTGYDETGEIRLSVYRGAIVEWVVMAGLIVVACWLFLSWLGELSIHHKPSAKDLLIPVFTLSILAFCLAEQGGGSITTLALEGKQFIVRERWLTTSNEVRLPVTLQSRPRIKIDYDLENSASYLIQVMTPAGSRITVARRWRLASAQALLRQMDEIIDRQGSRADHA